MLIENTQNDQNHLMSSRSKNICVIEQLTELTSESKKTFALCLTSVDDSFHFSLISLDNSPTKRISAILQPSNISTFPWKHDNPFTLSCSDFQFLSFSEHNKQPSISFLPNKEIGQELRTFLVPSEEFLSLTQLVEKLLLRGIVVPSPKAQYSLEFYERCHNGVYLYVPPDIQLEVTSFTNIIDLWDKVHNFFSKLLLYLDSSDGLPKDPTFPLGAASRASHSQIMEEIEKYIKELGSPSPIRTKEDLYSFFDPSGRIIDPDRFKRQLYFNGISPKLLPNVLPFVLGLFNYRSTTAERIQVLNHLIMEYDNLKLQVDTALPEQIASCKRLFSAHRVIVHDVGRTDRSHPAFKETDGIGLNLLSKFLKIFAVYNPPLSYLQGMNDLFVPIMLAFIPEWDDQCHPLNLGPSPLASYQIPPIKPSEIYHKENSSSNNNYEELEPLIFWCFNSMLQNTKHIRLIGNVTLQCQIQASNIMKLLARF